MSKQKTSHGLKFQARAIAAQLADTTGRPQWLTGTTSLREENEVQVLRLDDSDLLRPVGSYAHQSEIWSIAASPANSWQLATVYNEGGVYKASIWSMLEGSRELHEECQLEGDGGSRAVRWHPREHSKLATVEDGCLIAWQLAGGVAKESGRAANEATAKLWAGAWSSRDASQFCTCAGNSLQLWDLRTMEQSSKVPEAHASTIRDVDFGNQSDHRLATSGEDGRIKVWDTRALEKPVLEVMSHAHWAWQAKFNPAHDQLLLSAGSDSMVNLLHLSGLGGKAAAASNQPPKHSPSRSLSSAPNGTCAASFDCHEDSVYGVAWGASDPWVFASVSHDGRVAVNRVPGNLKYQILI